MIRSAALLITLLPLSASAQDDAAAGALGRLFYAPAERAAIVEARRAPDPQALPGGEAPDAGTPAANPVPLLRLDGLVHRDALPSIAFLNGRPVEDGSALLEYRVIASPRGVTLLTGSGQRIHLLVGQTLLRDEGRIVDPLPPHSLSSPP